MSQISQSEILGQKSIAYSSISPPTQGMLPAKSGMLGQSAKSKKLTQQSSFEFYKHEEDFGKMQLFLDSKQNEQKGAEGEDSANQGHRGSKKIKKQHVRDVIAKQNHYKIGASAEIAMGTYWDEDGCNETRREEEGNDLEGWLEKQRFKKNTGIKLTSDVEEEARREIQNRLISDICVQDSPELNFKIIGSIMRDRPDRSKLLIKSEEILKGLKIFSKKNQDNHDSVKENHLLLKNKDGRRDDTDEHDGSKHHNSNSNKIHTSTATSAKLLRIYKQDTHQLIGNSNNGSSNPEGERRQRTIELVQMVGAMKVMKEQAKANEQVWSDESVHRVLEVGKSTAKKALKTFKGLGSLMVDQLLTSQQLLTTMDKLAAQNLRIKKNNVHANSAFTSSLNNNQSGKTTTSLTGNSLNTHITPFSEIVSVYLPRHHSIYETIQKIKLQQTNLRIESAILNDQIKSKNKEYLELAQFQGIHLSDAQNQLKNSYLNHSSMKNSTNSDSSNLNYSYTSYKGSSSVAFGEFNREKRKKEVSEMQLKTILVSINELRQKLVILKQQNKDYEDKLTEQKGIRARISAHVKDTLVDMMKKDLAEFVTLEKPVNLSLPLIISVVLKVGENVYEEYFPEYLDSESKKIIMVLARLMATIEDLQIRSKTVVGTEEREMNSKDKQEIKEDIYQLIREEQCKLEAAQKQELSRIEGNAPHFQFPLNELRNILIATFGVVNGTQQLQSFLQFRKFQARYLSESKITFKEKRDYVMKAKDGRLLTEDTMLSVGQNGKNIKTQESSRSDLDFVLEMNTDNNKTEGNDSFDTSDILNTSFRSGNTSSSSFADKRSMDYYKQKNNFLLSTLHDNKRALNHIGLFHL